jgi:hypothetical protein
VSAANAGERELVIVAELSEGDDSGEPLPPPQP